MTDSEIEKLLVKLEQFRKELENSPSKAKKFLVDAGIITKNGNLRNRYKNLCTPQE